MRPKGPNVRTAESFREVEFLGRTMSRSRLEVSCAADGLSCTETKRSLCPNLQLRGGFSRSPTSSHSHPKLSSLALLFVLIRGNRRKELQVTQY